MRLFVALAMLSLTVILSGFLYDVYFAGIPFQDPTPEIQSRWIFHKGVSRILMLSGALGLGLVVLATVVTGIRRRRNKVGP